MIGHIYRKSSRVVLNTLGRMRIGRPDDFMAEDWDILILLDACREDIYSELTPYNSQVGTRVSPGSASHEFIKHTFLNRTLHDTVYVTPNPYVSMLEGDEFHAVHDCRDAWDEDLETVPPETMADRCREVASKYPNKRLILHFMQPHIPYLGQTARAIRNAFDFGGWNPDHHEGSETRVETRPSIWDLALEEKIEWAEVRTAYAETLDMALGAVSQLVTDLEGRVVISADHGDLLGERLLPFGPREWAHPEGFHVRPLRVVPWQVVQEGPRREVRRDPPVASPDLEEEEVEHRLRALGYQPDHP